MGRHDTMNRNNRSKKWYEDPITHQLTKNLYDVGILSLEDLECMCIEDCWWLA